MDTATSMWGKNVNKWDLKVVDKYSPSWNEIRHRSVLSLENNISICNSQGAFRFDVPDMCEETVLHKLGGLESLSCLALTGMKLGAESLHLCSFFL